MKYPCNVNKIVRLWTTILTVGFYGLLRAFIINKFYVIGLRINIFSPNFNIDMNW
jgi:hypothetical protein